MNNNIEELAHYPTWVRQMAQFSILENVSITKLGEKFAKSRVTIYKYLRKDDINLWIIKQREELLNEYRSKLNSLVPKAFETYENLLNNPKVSERVKFEAARDILRGKKMLTETQDVNVKGGVVVNIVPPAK